MPDLVERRGNVLIVDDSLTSRAWARIRLERAGYNVYEAKSGNEALSTMVDRPPDLVLLDVILPDLDGFEITRRLRGDPRFAAIPVILLTALDDSASRIRGLEAGANDFLGKPPDEAELLARVATLLRLQRNREALVAEKAKTELLYRISRELSAEVDLGTLLLRIIELTIASLSATRGSIILLDRDGQAMRTISSVGRKAANVTSGVWSQVMQKGLAGWVIQNKEGALIPDTLEDSRWVTAQSSHSTMRSALAVPLIHAGRVTGVLTMTHEEVAHFTPVHLDMLNSIASQAAVVIEKARAYLKEQVQARQLQLVNQVSHQATSILAPAQLLKEVARQICQTFDFYYVELALREGDELSFQGWGHGRHETMRAPQIRQSLSEPGVTSWAASKGQPLLVLNVREDPRYHPVVELPDTISELAVPLIVGDEILGVLDVQSDHAGQLTEDEVPLLETLASEVAVALKNARLFQERERRITELAILNEIGRAVSSTLEMDDLLEAVYQQVGRLFDATNFFIATYEQDRDEWTLAFGREHGQRDPQTGHVFRVGAGLTGHILRTRQPLLFRSTAELVAFHQAQKVQVLGEVARSWLGVPLISADALVGVMAIQSYEQEGLYDQQDQALFSTIAAQMSSALQNARLYTQTERERRKLSAVLAGTADAVVVTDEGGQVLLLNPAAEQAIGVPAEKAAGRPIAQVIPSPALVELFRSAGIEAPAHFAEIPLGDQRTFYASVSSVAGVGHVAVLQDITHLKELERMKNEFVATVSHDLRNPLTSIIGFADMLIQTEEESRKEALRHIRNSAKHMADLVADLLDLSKIESGVGLTQTPCQLETIVSDAVQSAVFQAEMRQITLTASVAPELRPILGDPGRLRQVLDNLINNALKYTPTGGRVTVRAWQDENRTAVSVQDTGIGIPRDALPHLFGKFYRVPGPQMDEIPGTGLGLAIVKTIMEQHDGQVWVESEVGKGSTFGFSVPAYEEN